jgi:hypothetical protein
MKKVINAVVALFFAVTAPGFNAYGQAEKEKSRNLVPIKSYAVVQAWRQAGALKGQHVRLTGEAEVKRTERGVYAVFTLPTGRRIATVSVRNDDAGPLLQVKVGESAAMKVNLETTIKGTGEGGALVLADSEFLPLDAPEGFALLEEPSAETGYATGAASGKANPGPPSKVVVPVYVPVPVPVPVPGVQPSLAGIGPGGTVNVRGYYRKDGTYVSGYTRAAPGMGTGRRR